VREERIEFMIIIIIGNTTVLREPIKNLLQVFFFFLFIFLLYLDKKNTYKVFTISALGVLTR
jgi:predicted membrane protein